MGKESWMLECTQGREAPPEWKKEEVVKQVRGLGKTVREKWYIEEVCKVLVRYGRWRGKEYYVENCIRFIENRGYSYGGVRTAWKLLEGAGIWSQEEAGEMRKRGWKVRKLRPGQRYGQHVWMSKEVWKGLCEIGEGDGVVGRETKLEGWKEVYALEHPVAGKRGEGGKPAKASCPFHEDRKPSASIWLNEDGVSGGGICFRCMAEGGGNLTFAVKQVEGKYYARAKQGEEGSKDTSRHSYEGKEDLVWEVEAQRWEGLATQIEVPTAGKPVERQNREEKAQESGKKELKWGSYSGWGHKPVEYKGERDFFAYGLERVEVVQTAVVQLERGESYSYLSQPTYKEGSVYEVLEKEEKMSQWPSRVKAAQEWECEQEQNPGGAWLPDRLMHVSQVKYEKRWVGCGGNQFPVYENAQAVYQRNILLDIDNMEKNTRAEQEAIHGWVQSRTQGDRRCSGRYGVVQTSPTGIQIWLELNKVYKAKGFFEEIQVKQWLLNLQVELRIVLKECGAGGEIDPSAFAAGRLGRRPGWRTLKTGGKYRSCLLYLNKEAKTPDNPAKWKPVKKKQQAKVELKELVARVQECV